MVSRDTLEYVIGTMLNANVEKEKIIRVSRNLASLLGAKSEDEVEKLTREYLYPHEKY